MPTASSRALLRPGRSRHRTGVPLDEDIAEGAVLAEQNGLQADHLSSARNMATTGAPSGCGEAAAQGTACLPWPGGGQNRIIWLTVTESSSTSRMGRLRARSRMSRKMRTRSTVSAAISGSAASSS